MFMSIRHPTMIISSSNFLQKGRFFYKRGVLQKGRLQKDRGLLRFAHSPPSINFVPTGLIKVNYKEIGTKIIYIHFSLWITWTDFRTRAIEVSLWMWRSCEMMTESDWPFHFINFVRTQDSFGSLLDYFLVIYIYNRSHLQIWLTWCKNNNRQNSFILLLSQAVRYFDLQISFRKTWQQHITLSALVKQHNLIFYCVEHLQFI